MVEKQEIDAVIPGHELLNKGLKDLRAFQLTEEALLVLVGQRNLSAVGLDIPIIDLDGLPEHKLYQLLSVRLGNGAHSAYNALIGRLCSAERILRVK